MLQGCRLFKPCSNLPAGNSVAGVQPVKVVWKPYSWALLGRDAGCSMGVGTYLPCTVGKGCRLFNRGPNLPPGHCRAGVQAV